MIRIPEGNEFYLGVPMCARRLTGGVPRDVALDATELDDITVTVGDKPWSDFVVQDGVVCLHVTAGLPIGVYHVHVTASLGGVPLAVNHYKAMRIVAWNQQSDWEGFSAGCTVMLPVAYCVVQSRGTGGGSGNGNESGGSDGGQSAGTSNYVHIDTVISDEQDGTLRLYIAIPEGTDMTDVTLQFGRMSRTRLPKSAGLHRTTGWHQVWALPVKNKVPLIQPVLKPAWQTYHGMVLHELTVPGEDRLADILDQETGYVVAFRECVQEAVYEYDEETGEEVMVSEPVYDVCMVHLTFKTILRKRCGVCLVRDGKIISNYARFAALERRLDTCVWELHR